jgi:hypothetical protein
MMILGTTMRTLEKTPPLGSGDRRGKNPEE